MWDILSIFFSDVWQVRGTIYARVQCWAWSWWKSTQTWCGIAEQSEEQGSEVGTVTCSVTRCLLNSFQTLIEARSVGSPKNQISDSVSTSCHFPKQTCQIDWKKYIIYTFDSHSKPRKALKQTFVLAKPLKLQRHVTHWDPKVHFPISLHCERSICKMVAEFFFTLTAPAKWLIS